CPVFETGSAVLAEGACTYGRAGASRTDQESSGETGGARFEDTFLLIGGQTEIAPDLFLGGAIGYRDTRMSGDDGVSADGYSVQGAVTLKYQTGPWLLTGAVFGNFGEDDVEREVGLGAYGGVAEGTATSRSFGLRARAAYTAGSERLYLRPSLTLDGLYARTDAWKEDGV
ncbi:autotransporter outer membrane beta-barrel domain-containing protein, partial [Poseidonocella sp. HB161398]|uniref:autotransporter outer membrane beta-barrel domain-containing protein n=1 Tax=Poseidonocella sp. HB161398 TaxID=2320855 RepID=UPI0011093272